MMRLRFGGEASRDGLGASLALLKRIFSPGVDDDENTRRQHGRALLSLGRQALAARDTETAFSLFAAAHAADDDNAVALTNLGVLASRRGDMVQAVDYALAAVARDPGSITARVNAVRYLLAQNRDADARREVEAVLARAPDRADAHALRGILDARAGDFAAARKAFERALSLDPKDEDAKRNLARLPPI
jgi:tetratricopeptide (TPR) repeat protein